MANVTITQLPAVTSVTGSTAVVPVVDAGVTDKITVNNLVKSGLPSQTGNANKVLGTNGTDVSWVAAAPVLTGATTSQITALGVGSNTTTPTQRNTLIGVNTGAALTSGNDNTFVGFQAGDTQTTGFSNVAVGSNALGQGTTSNGNVAIGHNALFPGGGGSNVAVGFESGKAVTSGGNNVFIGAGCGNTVTSLTNAVLIGANAGAATLTAANGLVAVGYQSYDACTSGASNTGCGYQTGLAVTTGSRNTFMGWNTGKAVATTNDNTMVGYQAGTLATGGGNTLVGSNAGGTITTGTNNTLVGAYAGTAALAGVCALSDGAGTIRLYTNATGALSFNGTAFGTAGQVLKSNGTGAAPTWVVPTDISYTFATLPTGAVGMKAVVTDGADALAWGDAVTVGGGTAVYQVWYNGTNWTVTGK